MISKSKVLIVSKIARNACKLLVCVLSAIKASLILPDVSLVITGLANTQETSNRWGQTVGVKQLGSNSWGQTVMKVQFTSCIDIGVVDFEAKWVFAHFEVRCFESCECQSFCSFWSQMFWELWMWEFLNMSLWTIMSWLNV